jgi:hypothetical protein
MSEVNQQAKAELSNDEKVEFLKAMFSTLEIDEQAIFTQWCHEQVEKGGAKFLGQKMQEVNDKMNNFIAKAYDQATKGAKFIYDKGNEAFEVKKNDVPENNSKPKDDGGPSFFS